MKKEFTCIRYSSSVNWQFVDLDIKKRKKNTLPICFIMWCRGMKVGDPREQDTQVGALISKEHLAKVRSFIDLARKEGATVHCGEGVDELTLKPEHKNVSEVTLYGCIYWYWGPLTQGPHS